MRMLICPDKFRGTATAAEAAAALADAVRQAGHTPIVLPLADGGEGTLDAFGGANRHTIVTGPLGTLVEAGWRLDVMPGVGQFAVIESALASGLLLAGGSMLN